MTNDLHLVHVAGPSLPDAAVTRTWSDWHPGCTCSTPRYAARPQVYHALKRRPVPECLLVAPLSAAPKFKGMTTGALAWLRERGYRARTRHAQRCNCTTGMKPP